MKKIFGIICACLMVLGLCACSNSFIKDNSVAIKAGEGDTTLDEFKSGTMKSYSSINCGDAFEYYFADTGWSQFKGESVSDAVEFTGKCIYQDFDADVLMQFALSDDGKTFTPEFLSFNQIPQTRETLEDFLQDIFETYSSYNDSGKGKGTSDVFSPIVEEEKESTETPTEGTEETGESAMSKEGVNYPDAYGDLLALAMSSGNNSRYYLYDMDGDGIHEMILSGSDTIGKYSNKVYKPVESSAGGEWSYSFIGEVPNEVEIHAASGGLGFITIYNGESSQVVERVYIADSGKLQIESLYEGSNAEGRYNSAGPLKWAAASDNSLLIKGMDASYSGVETGSSNTGNVSNSMENTISNDSEYIIPNSNTVLLQKADLARYTKEELRLARNEILARHGYIFKTDEIKEYFESKSWYTPTIPADDFDMNSLSETEYQNMQTIKSVEKE